MLRKPMPVIKLIVKFVRVQGQTKLYIKKNKYYQEYKLSVKIKTDSAKHSLDLSHSFNFNHIKNFENNSKQIIIRLFLKITYIKKDRNAINSITYI